MEPMKLNDMVYADGTYTFFRADGNTMSLWRNEEDEWGYALYDQCGSLTEDGTHHLDPEQGTLGAQLLTIIHNWRKATNGNT